MASRDTLQPRKQKIVQSLAFVLGVDLMKSNGGVDLFTMHRITAR